MILIVEDQPTARRAMQQLLRFNGYETQAVGSAEEALQLADDGQVPDVALVDVHLPGMNGVDLVENLCYRNPALFPVFITSCEREDLPPRSVRSPTRYLRKPLQIDALLKLMGTVGAG